MPLTNTSMRAIKLARTDSVPPPSSGRIDPWAGSPFEWMRRSDVDPNVAGVNFFARLCELHLGEKPKPTAVGGVHLLRGRRLYVCSDVADEFFSVWAPTEPDYDIFVAVTVMPSDAAIWAIPRSVILSHLSDDEEDPAALELSFRMQEVPDWLESSGGTIERGLAALIRSL